MVLTIPHIHHAGVSELLEVDDLAADFLLVLAVPLFPLNLLPVALFLFATSFFFRTAIFWVLIGGALVAFANSWLLRKVFKKNFGLD